MLDSGLGVFSEAERNTAGGIGVDLPSSPEYEFVRGGGGWTTTPVAAPSAAQFLSGGMQGEDASPDLGRTLWKLRTPSQPEGEGDLYRREGDGTFVHMGPLQPASVAPLFGNEGTYLGASHDLAHVLVGKKPGQGPWPGDTTSGVENWRSLYEYGGTNEPEPLLVGIKNEGRLASNTEAQLISRCTTRLGSGSGGNGLGGSAYNAISASGAIVYFTATACSGEPAVNELYARIDEAHTVAISEPALPAGECTGSCATAEHREGSFVGASEDGSKVFFTSEQPLFNGDKDSTNDLYGAEVSATGVKRLVMVSEGETHASAGENDATPGKGAGVLGVARIAEDGSHIYFAATGVLTQASNGQGGKAEAGADNLYVFDMNTQRTAFVAKLAPKNEEGRSEDEGIWQQADNGRPAVATPDGRFLVFVSHADLLGEATTGSQLYEYDASSGSLRRISLGQHSSAEAFAPKILSPSYDGESDLVTGAQSHLTMSDDGTYVFFESPDSLTLDAPDDQAAGCLSVQEPGTCGGEVYTQNVYEYHEGRVSLIASVRPTSFEPVLTGTTHSGSDVFFTTAESLVAQDTDTQRDIYDARIDGGFSAPAQQVGCSGGGCHGPLSAAPQFIPPGSTMSLGGGDLTQPVVRQLSAAQRLVRTLKACRAKRGGHQRRVCEAKARRRFKAEAKAKSTRGGK